MGFIPPVGENSPFTLHNIPFGVISTSADADRRCATAVGDYALDLRKYSRGGHLDGLEDDVKNSLTKSDLNEFAALSASLRSQVRRIIIEDITLGRISSSAFVSLKEVTMQLPMRIGDFTDFVSSFEHMQNCAGMIATKIPPSFNHMPLGYNGRVSSIGTSGQKFRRPKGVVMRNKEAKPEYLPTQSLDYELELGCFVSKPVSHGETIDAKDARDHIFGFVLLNDWTSRDIQAFEMAPLGPFNSKGTATTISPWIVTLDALEPFSCDPLQDMRAMPAHHLQMQGPVGGSFDISLTASIVRNGRKYVVCRSNLKNAYWTPYQEVIHHSTSGCGMQTGDLIGTGTLSGPDMDASGRKTALGCLFESTVNGTGKWQFEDGEVIGFLEDGDEVVLEGWCGRDGQVEKFGFGECRSLVLPAGP